MAGLGERIVELSFAGDGYHPETIRRFKEFFSRLPDEMQDMIIINGILNALFEAFEGDQNINRVISFMLKDEKERIKWKYYVRYA